MRHLYKMKIFGDGKKTTVLILFVAIISKLVTVHLYRMKEGRRKLRDICTILNQNQKQNQSDSGNGDDIIEAFKTFEN